MLETQYSLVPMRMVIMRAFNEYVHFHNVIIGNWHTSAIKSIQRNGMCTASVSFSFSSMRNYPGLQWVQRTQGNVYLSL